VSAQETNGTLVPPSVHEAIGLRLAGLDQRYTPMRRVLVETLAQAGHPVTIPKSSRRPLGCPRAAPIGT